jgi:hypothetical protein
MSDFSKRYVGPAALLLAATTIWPVVAVAEVVVVPVPSPYSYDSATLRQLNLRGTKGRYIGFIGHSVIDWPAEPARFDAGNPGTTRCNSNTCWREGYIAPTLLGCIKCTAARRSRRKEHRRPAGSESGSRRKAHATFPLSAEQPAETEHLDRQPVFSRFRALQSARPGRRIAHNVLQHSDAVSGAPGNNLVLERLLAVPGAGFEPATSCL